MSLTDEPVRTSKGSEPVGGPRQRHVLTVRIKRGMPREERTLDTGGGIAVPEMAARQREFLARIPGPLVDLKDDELAE